MKRPFSDRKLRLFFSGIGGSGMSALAAFMADQGHSVSGSDRAFDTGLPHPAKETLERQGIILYPQNGSGMKGAVDLAVFSTAVEENNPDRVHAEGLGIPMTTRPLFLAEIAEAYRSVAVAGTSGKSTTSGMLACIMRDLGMSPNFIGGGRVKALRDSSHLGNECAGASDFLVIEACESDGSIVHFKPWSTIILNLDLDHSPIEETAALFRVLSGKTGGPVIMNADDPHLTRSEIRHHLSFSIHAPSHYRATDIASCGFGTSFTVNGQRYKLSLPGHYNVYNALACIAVLTEIGVPPSDISRALPRFTGIERRCDILLCDGQRLVIDDYAHNPHKISSFMQMISALSPSVCYVFQPHGFGPTMLMRQGYVQTFIRWLRPQDHLILLPIYYAGGTASRAISSDDLAREIAEAGRSVEAATDRAQVLNRATHWHSFAVLGARDESLADLARRLADTVRGSSADSR